MTSLTLDGSTRYVGTDFVKILNTGTSNLATEDFVLEQVASGGTSTTDLPGYYNLTQTNTLLDTKYNITAVNTLLDTKLNIGNPQDISGVMRLGHIDGLSKIILNSVGSNGKDFMSLVLVAFMVLLVILLPWMKPLLLIEDAKKLPFTSLSPLT